MHLPSELSHKPVSNTKLILSGCLSWGWPLFPLPRTLLGTVGPGDVSAAPVELAQEQLMLKAFPLNPFLILPKAL